MAITLDATAATATGFLSQITIAGFTAATGTLVRVDVGAGTNTDCTGVTFKGNALTEVFDQNLAGAGVVCRVASFLGIVGPDGTPGDVVVDWAASITAAQWARVSTWNGVDISSVAASHRTIYSAGDSAGTGADVTVVDSQAGDAVVSATMSFHTTLTASETDVGSPNNNIAGDGKSCGVQVKIATGASTVMGWADDTFNTHVAYALVPAAVAGDAAPTLRVVSSPLRYS